VFFVVVVLYLASYNLYFFIRRSRCPVCFEYSLDDRRKGGTGVVTRRRTDGRTDGRTEDDDEGGRGKNGDDASSGEFSTRNGGNARAGEEGAR